VKRADRYVGTAALTVCEVARRLNVSQRTVYRILETGQLHGVRAGRLWRVPVDAVDEYLRAGRHPNVDDEQLSAEDLEAIRAGLAAIERGEWVTLDEYERQRR